MPVCSLFLRLLMLTPQGHQLPPPGAAGAPVVADRAPARTAARPVRDALDQLPGVPSQPRLTTSPIVRPIIRIRKSTPATIAIWVRPSL